MLMLVFAKLLGMAEMALSKRWEQKAQRESEKQLTHSKDATKFFHHETVPNGKPKDGEEGRGGWKGGDGLNREI
jgi:hypothetical protein